MGGHGSHELNTATRGCKGNGQRNARAIPTTSFRVVAKNPSPTTPSGGSTIFMFELLIVLYFELENLNHEPYKLILIQCL
jgi:hypothetical protein